MLLDVSIVIAAYNEEKVIGKLLDSLMDIDYPKKKMEIIVVDDGSTDRTTEIVSKYPVKLIKVSHKGVGIVRNLGVKTAKNDLIFFFDADMIVDRKYLKEVMKYFEKHGVVVAGGTTLLNNKNRTLARMLHLRNILGIVEYNFPFASICSKKIFNEAGGFDPDYGYYDDWVLAQKIKEKYKIHRISKAKVRHNEPGSWKEVWRRCKWTGKSMIPSFKGYKKDAFRRVLFPLLCVPLPFYVAFLFLSFPFWVLGLIGLILFLLVEIRRSVKMYQITKWKESFLTPFFDFITMFLVFIGMLIGLIYRALPKA